MEEIIEHHGVKGQKWGVRRKAVHAARVEAKAQKKDSIARAKSWNKTYQSRGKMSDDELRKAVSRLQLENQFAQQAALASASSRSTGKKYLDKYGEETLNNVASSAARGIVKLASATARRVVSKAVKKT